jgi:hypothetical protein
LCKTFCDGYYIISNARSAPSSIPSVASTGKSFAPTSAAPNTPIQMTTFASYVDCDFVSLQYPETKPCFFNACEGTYLSIVNIFHKGEYNGNMEASLYNSVSKIYSASDFYFVDGFTTSAYAFCQVILNLVSNIDYVLWCRIDLFLQTYTLIQMCPGAGSCSGRFVVFGGFCFP